MTFDCEDWKRRLNLAKTGAEIHAMVMELPERTSMEVALERGYVGQEAQDYADMLDWTGKIDNAKSSAERFQLIEQMPERIKPLWANFNHPS